MQWWKSVTYARTEKKNGNWKITNLERPSSRMACSSGVQSRDMPGLCFMFTAARGAPPPPPEELSGTELPLKEDEGTWACCSWWFPDGFAIDNLNLILLLLPPFLKYPNLQSSKYLSHKQIPIRGTNWNWQLLPAKKLRRRAESDTHVRESVKKKAEFCVER